MDGRVSRRIQPLGDYRAQLGETPVWCGLSRSLLWVDILGGKLLRYWPGERERTEIRTMPRFTSAVLLTSEPERFLVVSQSGISLYHYAAERFSALCDWPESDAETRPNEAAIAPDGALWFSSMDPAAQNAIGSWYRLAGGQTRPQKLLGNQWVPNTLQWWGQHVWFADSLRHRMYCASLVNECLDIAHAFDVEGIPDGSTLTQDGILINARWGDARLACCQLGDGSFRETGSVMLPVQQPSSCTFGGDTLSDLYVTSARDGLTTPSPVDGALLRITTQLTGAPARRFRL
ncbi:SMP-30/gluconolactonase/LRE family protein [Enterobacillus tribolii]|uniref:Sugar lactone lactonase YvrE n=1 Tax=Enterobacillus tribolii TaxID=1487935 RepID=A0A370R256_9GAMM|nr:SMP-30/gluconolactonase/LRE family protein [Enterobacillus tribolii]MBW7984818.1 SMP-30/gluconolactonase/LRE family protein [Enterobacillus tribolii]RDK96010.1 sugar lactone lactonase YvrE [Enterobacillus tribolii]